MKLKTVLPLVLFLLLTLSSTLLSQEMNAEAKQLLMVGDSLAKAQDYQKAIQTYDQALALSKDYRIYFQKSLAQKKAQDLEGAKASLEECLKLKDDFDAAYNALGIVQFSIGNFQEARINFEKFLTLSNTPPIAIAVIPEMARLPLPRRYRRAMKSSNRIRRIPGFEDSKGLVPDTRILESLPPRPLSYDPFCGRS